MISDYYPPLLFRNAHIQTIYPSLFRNLETSFYHRERITTPDNDFLDLDWSIIDSKRLAILCHGLEGSSHRSYMVGMVNALNKNGWDALAWNYRGCSGEFNRQLRFYHSGAVDDLNNGVAHALKNNRYHSVALIGFSMGGNLILVYLGQKKYHLDPRIKKAIAFSVPCDLAGSAEALSRFRNKIYMKRFLKMLHIKIKAKMELFPDQISDHDYHTIKNFKQYDDRYTAPIHSFTNADDYWRQCSSKQFIPHIQVPTLIISAHDDPFLAPSCYPFREAAQNKLISLVIPKWGGHVGFVEFNNENMYWSEKQAVRFLNT